MTKFNRLTVLAGVLVLAACTPVEQASDASAEGTQPEEQATVAQAAMTEGDTDEQAETTPPASKPADEPELATTEEPAESTGDQQVAMADPQAEAAENGQPKWVEFFTSGELLCTESGGTFRLWASRDGNLKTEFSVNSPLTGSWEVKGPNSMGWELSRGNRTVFPYQVVTAKMQDDGTMVWGPTTCKKN